MKLKEIAERLGCRLAGDGDIEIRRITGIDDAAPGDLTFFANPKYAAHLKQTRASALILGDKADVELPTGIATLRTSHPYFAFARAAEIFAPRPSSPAGVNKLASVAPTATVASDASIGAFVSIGDRAKVGARTIVYPHATIGEDAAIGADCVIHARVSVRERVVIGDRVVIQDGAVIGSDGFGFAQGPDGSYQKIPQVGGVVIEDDGETRIGAGTKIDNLVQVAHGVKIGRRTLLAAQVGIAGSTILEDNVTLAGQVGVAGHITIGKGVTATAQTGIPNSVDPGTLISGYPAIANRDWLKSSAVFRKLPELKKAVADLQHRLAELEQRLKR